MIDERAVSTTINYALNLSIITILMTALLATGGSFIQDQREQIVHTELQTIGQRIAGDLMAVDRLVQSSSGETIKETKLKRTLPNDVAGSRYTIIISDSGEITLETRDPQATVVVNYASTTPVIRTSVAGGEIVVEYDDSGSIEVNDG